ncbi:glycosyltransferase family 2 protein [Weissella cibaria]|uniref:glycosyltransferase family 2 protein n=1 Tax=Weissella cibaria TaxID=137591 RepID=UPI0011938B37|nr:glycosyltransferase family 2 protein [Weissella cibaria]TVV25978.1 glycosyltransferase family 2 protein [Weissella cibaria]
MMKTCVSLIMPVYNSEKYLQDMLLSIDYQTFDDFEVVVVNDGSTDESDTILQTWQQMTRATVKYVTQENRGVSSARNTGISLASGEYLIFIDCDDVLGRDFVEKYANEIQKTESDFVFFNAYIMQENENISSIQNNKVYQGKITPKEMLCGLAQQQLFAYPFSFISRKMLWDALLWDERQMIHEDLYVLFRMALTNPNLKVWVSSDSAYQYRQHEFSALGRDFDTVLNNIRKVSFQILDLAIRNEDKAILRGHILWIGLLMMQYGVRSNQEMMFKEGRRLYLSTLPTVRFNDRKIWLRRWIQGACAAIQIKMVFRG